MMHTQFFATVGIKREEVGEVMSATARLASKMPNLSTWEGEKTMLLILQEKRESILAVRIAKLPRK